MTPYGTHSPPKSCSRGTGYDIRTAQELLGHADVKTAMIYANVLKVGGGGVSWLAVVGSQIKLLNTSASAAFKHIMLEDARQY